MKLPWDIIDAKNSHVNRGVWTYPLKKTLPKAIVHKNVVLIQGITSPEVAGSWGVPEAGTVGLGKELRLFAFARGVKSESHECDRMLNFLSL